MITSLRNLEGYLRIDDRASGGALVERATVTCSHCHRLIVLNPLRTRPHDYCPGCDHIICRRCEVIRHANGGQCLTLEKVMDQLQETATKNGDT